jgi:hypothetical protein
VYGNGKFIITPSPNQLNASLAVYSEDGITWTQTDLPTSQPWNTPVYINNKFILMPSNTFAVSSIAAYSEDGITWTQINLPSPQNWEGLAYGNDRFILNSDTSSIVAYSEDGITWNQADLPTDPEWYVPMYGNGRFILTPRPPDSSAQPSSSAVIYSEDGITWKDTYEYVSQNNTDITDDLVTILSDNGLIAPPQAEVGQILQVKAVNPDGKPIEWEAIDFPDASSVILKSSTEGSTKKFRITIDDSGILSTIEVTE